MPWIEVRDIGDPTPDNKVAMTVAATGKPLVLPIKEIRIRMGDMILVDGWLYERLAPYLGPPRGPDGKQSGEGMTAGPTTLPAGTGTRRAPQQEI